MKFMNIKKVVITTIALMMVIPNCYQIVSAKNTDEPRVLQTHKVGEVYQASEHNRQQINFNRDWKFNLGDVEGAQVSTFDDSEWNDVALPHTFDLPYNMSSNFYVGYGWYRKSFTLDEETAKKQISIEFEGSFQVTEVYVNEKLVGTHEGGYTGFTFDITDDIHPGENEIAIRVNNIWQPDLAPRAGDHQFTGGIYRDVTLSVTDDVHVSWYGTFVTTPDLLNPAFDASAQNVLDNYIDEKAMLENIKQRRSNVRVQTEVKNESNDVEKVNVTHDIVDKNNKVIASFQAKEKLMEAGTIYNFDATSEQIKDIELWDVDNPYVYTVYTSVYKDNNVVDVFSSPLGFRSAQYKNDGFYLNGKKVLLDGANVHQDQGGWGNAVTNDGFYRDVQMIKDAGMNFIRGSHYPHDPAFASACDDIGILFWSECVFWGMGGCNGNDDPAKMVAGDWFKDAYPQNPADEQAFEDSCKQALTEMIRVNRNHPSIINWSMGNEVFFTNSTTLNKAKTLVSEMRNLAHQLDPTRKAGMGGVQREGFDKLEVSDIAGYNGDGGKFTNLTLPNIVAEYGSKTADRPGELRPFYDQIQGGDMYSYQLTENSAGLVLWSGFHHGTIGGEGLAKMGMIDYYRLPLNSWYWYREKNLGIKPEQSKQGEAAFLQVTSSRSTLKNDGTNDAQLIVTLLNHEREWVNASPTVTLRVVDGPGVFPTGKEYIFTPNNTIRDGKAAISFRSYYSGTTIIEASAPGLHKQQIEIITEDMTDGNEGVEPDGFMVTEPKDTTDKIDDPIAYGKSNVALKRPAFTSSNKDDSGLASDQDVTTQWVASQTGAGEYWMLDAEFTQYFYKAKLDFVDTPYPYKIEIANDKEGGPWTTVASYDKDNIKTRPHEESLHGIKGRYLKVTFTDVPNNAYANLADIAVYGNTSAQTPAYVTEQAYLSDLTPKQPIEQGWVGMSAGIDKSIEGNALTIAGITYEKGLGLHANSEAIYDLDGKYTRFQSTIGIDDETNGNGDAIYRIFAAINGQEEQLIYEKQLTGGQSEYVDLSVSNVQTLRLVTDANGANGSDHTNWADAKVVGAIRDISKAESGFKITYVGSQETLSANEKYTTSLQLTNIDNSSSAFSVSLALYDNAGNLIDMSLVNDYLSKGKSKAVNVSLVVPANFAGGEARLNVFETQQLTPYAKTTHIASSNHHSLNNVQKISEVFKKNSGHEVVRVSDSWIKVDGEDASLDKIGNWALWDAGEGSSAYMNTETYVEKNNWSGASISYTFNGTQASIYAKIDQSQDGAKIYIDGQFIDEISTKAMDNLNEYKEAWKSKLLPKGEHTIKIEPTGKFGLDYLAYNDGDVQEEVDKATLISLLIEVERLEEVRYTVESWQRLTISYNQAMTIRDDITASALQVEEAISNLQSSVNNLVEIIPIGNFEKLLVQMQRVLAIVENDSASEYTVTSVQAVSKQFEIGSMYYLQERVEQNNIDAATQTLKEALDNLQKEQETIDKSALIALINSVSSLQKDDYSTTSWKQLQAILANADEVNRNEQASQTKVDEALHNLMVAIDQLTVDKTALTGAVEKAQTIVENEATYLKGKQWTAFIAAVAEAEVMLANQDVTQKQIEEMKQVLESAQSLLIKIVNKKALKALLQSAQEMAEKGHYTVESLAILEDAMATAMTIIEDDEATDIQVNAAYNKLAEALANLATQVDKGALSSIIVGVDKLDLSKYTEDSVRDLKVILTDARSVLADSSATQTEVNDSIKAIKKAIDALVLKTVNGNQNQSGNNTGDTTNKMAWLGLMAASMLILGTRKRTRYNAVEDW